MFRSSERSSRDLDPTEFEFVLDRLAIQNEGLKLQVEQLHSRFEELEETCVASLRGIGGGLGHGLPVSSGDAQSFDQQEMPQWRSQSDTFTTTLDGTLMTTLAALSTKSAADVRAWLTKHPKFIAVFAECPPPADQVAAWWKSMGASKADASAVQYAFMSGAPAMIGNLGGVAYWARDTANRITVAQQLPALTKARKELDRLVLTGNRYTPRQVAEVLAPFGFGSGAELRDYEKALLGVIETLDSSGHDTFQLVSFNPGDHDDFVPSRPLAAISVGDMDAASQVTVAVPGMGTTVASSMQERTEASRNLYTQQNYLNHQFRTKSNIAVVAWIGYDTPKMPAEFSLEVLSSDKAKVGAQNLSSFLDGVTASHSWAPGQNLSIVAHSYGTTTATLALIETPVENLTLLASAGLDDSITLMSDLKVDPDRVWASEADGDGTADMGRMIWDHRVNPTEQSFGAQVFSSEAAVVDGRSLQGSDGHASAPQVSAGLNGDTTDEWGYLDQLTTPLYNTGLTSLGLGHTGQVVVK